VCDCVGMSACVCAVGDILQKVCVSVKMYTRLHMCVCLRVYECVCVCAVGDIFQEVCVSVYIYTCIRTCV